MAMSRESYSWDYGIKAQSCCILMHDHGEAKASHGLGVLLCRDLNRTDHGPYLVD